jgi:hypothetical protein
MVRAEALSAFRSFVMGGFECSTHRLKTGKRLDLVHSTAHDRYLREDYSRLKEHGILTVREGIRWHLIQPGRGPLDFSSVTPFVRTSQEMAIQVIWDLCHFGWPDHLDVFTPQWWLPLMKYRSCHGPAEIRHISTLSHRAAATN